MSSGVIPPRAAVSAANVTDIVHEVLAAFLATKQWVSCSMHPEAGIEVLERYILRGGKGIRSMLCLYGWEAAGGLGAPEELWDIAASLELFHTFALIHDDVMDRSNFRRGQISLHRQLERMAAPHIRDAAHFGESTAILFGDLCLVFSDELLRRRLDAAQCKRIEPLFQAMRVEIMMGQQLDLLATGATGCDLPTALLIGHYKTAKYTVERPLQLGAALAGGSPALMAACSGFAIPVGEAFQLRDDVLGVFGSSRLTGKPVQDDLAAGKLTPLAALALRRADSAQLAVLDRHLGDPGLSSTGAEAVRQVMRATGALTEVERLIRSKLDAGLAALESTYFPTAVRAPLGRLARSMVDRSR